MGRLLVIIILLAVIVGGAYYMDLLPKSAKPAAAPLSPTAPASHEDFYLSGDAYWARSEYLAAVATYRKALAQEPGSRKAPEALYRIGDCYEKADKPNDALHAYKDFVASYPDDVRVNKAKQRIDYLTETGAK